MAKDKKPGVQTEFHEHTIKHLEMTQGVINRLAGNSFMVKGWSLTVVTATLAFAFDKGGKIPLWIALLPAVVFWLLDAYFLHVEKCFRGIYKHVRTENKTGTDFSLIPNVGKGLTLLVNVFGVALSFTLALFHGPIVATVIYLAYTMPAAAT